MKSLSSTELARLYACRIGFFRGDHTIEENFFYVTDKWGVKWHDPQMICDVVTERIYADRQYDSEYDQAYRAMISVIEELWGDSKIPVTGEAGNDQTYG